MNVTERQVVQEDIALQAQDGHACTLIACIPAQASSATSRSRARKSSGLPIVNHLPERTCSSFMPRAPSSPMPVRMMARVSRPAADGCTRPCPTRPTPSSAMTM